EIARLVRPDASARGLRAGRQPGLGEVEMTVLDILAPHTETGSAPAQMDDPDRHVERGLAHPRQPDQPALVVDPGSLEMTRQPAQRAIGLLIFSCNAECMTAERRLTAPAERRCNRDNTRSRLGIATGHRRRQGR